MTCMVKVTLQVAATGAESAVYDCPVRVGISWAEMSDNESTGHGSID